MSYENAMQSEGSNVQACIKIQKKFVEWVYRPDGFNAQKFALHYACLQNIRTEMRQISNITV